MLENDLRIVYLLWLFLHIIAKAKVVNLAANVGAEGIHTLNRSLNVRAQFQSRGWTVQ